MHKTWFRFLLAEKKLDEVYRRRPRRPPFLLVESDGIGVTSSESKKGKNTLARGYKVPATNNNSFNVTKHKLSRHLPIWCWSLKMASTLLMLEYSTHLCVQFSCRNEPELWEQTELQDQGSLSWERGDWLIETISSPTQIKVSAGIHTLQPSIWDKLIQATY